MRMNHDVVAGNFSTKLRWLPGFALLVVWAPIDAASGQTTKYTYDSRGRLVKSEHSAGRNAGVETTQQYDRADNRVQKTTTGESRSRLVVIPLNGFTVISVDK